ncbi:MAG: hypothetical protein ISS52_05355 [Dehalococcoidia bacterium]|nr:hypothetical protein [Dehalococcoidia bacterium]
MPREVHRNIIIFERGTQQSAVGPDVNIPAFHKQDSAKPTAWLTRLLRACQHRLLPPLGKARKNTGNTIRDARRKETTKEDEEVVFKVIPI